MKILTMENINGLYMQSKLSPEEQDRIMRKAHDDLARSYGHNPDAVPRREFKKPTPPTMTEAEKTKLFKKALLTILGVTVVILVGLAISNFF